MRRLTTTVIREMLRLKASGLNHTQISASVNRSRPKVIEYLKKASELGIDWEKAQKIEELDLERLIRPEIGVPRYKKPEPDFQYIRDELKKHGNLNLQFLWDEYKKKDPDGLEYSQFCARYREWSRKRDVSMVMPREAGYELQVDWAGQKLEILCDRDTGEMHKVHFFVAAMGFSGYPYCEAFRDEKTASWTTAHIHAFEYYGGVPRILTPDNCRTATTRVDRYDPEINRAYQELCEHYDVAVVPARPGKPQDKPSAESSVKFVQTWILGKLRNLVFFTLDEINEHVMFLLWDLANLPFQKRSNSRYADFVEIDRPALRPLPTARYERPEWHRFKVPDSYHVPFSNHEYSVPYLYHTRSVDLRATATTIEVFHNGVRICSHKRSLSTRADERYVTDPEHMPESHRRHAENRTWDGARYRGWAENIGAQTAHVVDAMLRARKHEEQAYKSCMALLQLGKRHGNDRLEAACRKARSLGSCSFRTVQNILKNGQDHVTEANYTADTIAIAHHENERGAAYYQ